MKSIYTLIILSFLATFGIADEITGLNLRTTAGSQAVNPTAVAGAVLSLDSNKRPVFSVVPTTGINTFLATPSSANLSAAVTDETGGGALVFGTSPTIATPIFDAANNSGAGITIGASGWKIGRGNDCLVIYAPGAGISKFAFNTAGLRIATDRYFGFGDGTDANSAGIGAAFYYDALNTMQLGADAAGATTQTIKAADRITSDGVGSALVLQGGNGRGAAGGSLIFKTSPAAGAGVTGTPTTALTIDSAGVATFAPTALTGSQETSALDISQTWNTTGTPSAIKLRITNTASDVSSKLIDLGTTASGSLFSVASNGSVRTARDFYIDNNAVGAGVWFGEGGGDVLLSRDFASGTLAMRNSTDAQSFRIYNTYTSATNYERLVLDWKTTANTASIMTEKGSGGGTARSLVLGTNGTAALTISTAAITPTLKIWDNNHLEIFGSSDSATYINLGNGKGIGFSDGSVGAVLPTLFFVPDFTASAIQLGKDHDTTPTAQTLKAHDVATGTGASMTIAGGKGSVAGGDARIGTSVTNGAPNPRILVAAAEKTLTESTATIVCNVTVAAGKYIGGELIVTTHADDATDFQAITEHLTFSAVNKGGTVTATIQAAPSTSTTAASAGTLTTAWTAVANGNSVDIKNDAASSLTQTTLKCSYQLRLNTDDTVTVTP